ncbi:RICIN domain-containing protein [Nonomuraea indica]|uniref:RICIN domain-containing protein n=1 Tax=Nonomuraea indica TaxID=1581193 RepID=A0ABW8ADF1_9ACTN
MTHAFRRRAAAAALALVAAFSTQVLAEATTAGASSVGAARLAEAPGERRNIILWNIRSRRCVNGPGTDGGNVLLLRCNSGWGHDRWDLVKVKDGAGNDVPHQYVVVNTATKACLEIGGWSTADGATAMTYGCHQGTNQKWHLVARNDGYYEFWNVATKKCLDARFVEEWTDIYQWRCHQGGEQLWWIGV